MTNRRHDLNPYSEVQQQFQPGEVGIARGTVAPEIAPAPVSERTATLEREPMFAELGRGNRLLFWQQVNTPAASANWRYVHDRYNFSVEIVHVYFRLVTSAVVANRNPLLIVESPGGARLWMHDPNLAQAASITSDWQFNARWYAITSSAYSYNGGAIGLRIGMIPWCVLQKSFVLRSGEDGATDAPQAGDRYSNIWLLMRKLEM